MGVDHPDHVRYIRNPIYLYLLYPRFTVCHVNIAWNFRSRLIRYKRILLYPLHEALRTVMVSYSCQIIRNDLAGKRRSLCTKLSQSPALACSPNILRYSWIVVKIRFPWALAVALSNRVSLDDIPPTSQIISAKCFSVPKYPQLWASVRLRCRPNSRGWFFQNLW